MRVAKQKEIRKPRNTRFGTTAGCTQPTEKTMVEKQTRPHPLTLGSELEWQNHWGNQAIGPFVFRLVPVYSILPL